MSDVELQKYHVKLEDVLQGRNDAKEILEYVNASDVLLFPEEYVGQPSYNLDLINLIKELKSSGLNLHIINPHCGVIEKKAADIALDLGIITKDIVLQIVLSLVASFLYDKLRSIIQKDGVPKATITFYQKEKEKRVIYKGPADKVAEILKMFKSEEDVSE